MIYIPNSSISHQVILIGENHHNGLGLVRSFGVHGIRPYGIIIGANASKSFVRHSKYWQKVWFAKDETEVLAILLQQTFLDKPVLIPYSDGAAQMVDENLNTLSKHYLCPSIGGTQGKISHLMDKLEPTKLAAQLGLNMLPTQIIQISNPQVTLTFPIIIKPVISAKGKKSDIRICHTQEDLMNALELYKHNDYQQALVQSYLPERTEYVLTGSLFNTGLSFTICQAIRQWPIGRGSGSFSKVCTKYDVVTYATHVLRSLVNLGAQGPIDIEFFKDVSGQFYLNEINWRSSGRNFVCLYNNVHSAYYYYCSRMGVKLPNEPLINTKEGYSMNEATDFNHVLIGKLSLRQWSKDWRSTQSFALYYSKDLKPVFYQYFQLFKRGLKKYFKSTK